MQTCGANMFKKLMLPSCVLLAGLVLAWPFKKSAADRDKEVGQANQAAFELENAQAANTPQPVGFAPENAPPNMLVDSGRSEPPPVRRVATGEPANLVGLPSGSSQAPAQRPDRLAVVPLPQQRPPATLPPATLPAVPPSNLADFGNPRQPAGERSVLTTNPANLRLAPIGPDAPHSPNIRVREHTIRPGDTLPKLAIRYYGDPARWQEIYSANRNVLPHWDVLPIGAKIQIRLPE